MRSLLFLLLAATTASCVIVGDTFGGRFCKTDGDCPGVAGYLCVSGTKWPQTPCTEGEDACICEVKFPPDPDGIVTDGGGVVRPDAGPPPDYCTEIRPIINFSCVSTCHGAQMQYPGTDTLDFRLDYWVPDDRHKRPDGGPGLPGVKSKVDRIRARIWTDFRMNPMPPSGSGLDPTEVQRRLVDRWVDRFGAPLGDGGCEAPMMGTDSGVPDAGARDGGVDAGAPVQFAAQVLPIFQGNCGCHTGANMSGMLSLTAANAYNALVNRAVTAGCVGGPRMRVLPNQPMQSQLWLKASNAMTKCGNSMPNNAAQPLSLMNAAQFDIITRWILQGAPNN